MHIQTELDNPFTAPEIRQSSLVLNSLAGCQSSTISRKIKIIDHESKDYYQEGDTE